MDSRYRDHGAQAALEKYRDVGPTLALRTYTARLLGADPALVVHVRHSLGSPESWVIG